MMESTFQSYVVFRAVNGFKLTRQMTVYFSQSTVYFHDITFYFARVISCWMSLWRIAVKFHYQENRLKSVKTIFELVLENSFLRTCPTQSRLVRGINQFSLITSLITLIAIVSQNDYFSKILKFVVVPTFWKFGYFDRLAQSHSSGPVNIVRINFGGQNGIFTMVIPT